MTIQFSSGVITPLQPAESTYGIAPSQKDRTLATPSPPPPPPPPPPPKDVVQLSLAANVQRLKALGDTPVQISQTLGISVQTVSIDLGTSFIEAALSSAPTLPKSSGG